MTAYRNTRRDFLKQLGLGAGAVLFGKALPTSLAATKGKNKPNVIVFLTDDQGWTDTSVQMMEDRPDSKSGIYQTPNLERLASEGMIFSNAYSPAPVCTPSRASIQFGKTPARLRQTVVHDLIGSDCKNQTSIAEAVKSADSEYITAHFGKWGFHPRSPEHAQYDYTDGDTNNFHGDFRALDDRRPLPEDDPKRIFSLTKHANNFMEKQTNAGRPFFMQVSHYALHVKHDALPETVRKYRQKGLKPSKALYAAMIEDLDTGLGMLLDKIDELGIKDNTYIIFTSDNGAASNKPLKGGKAMLWEGGIRVPTVIRGPGVKSDCYCDVPVAGWDLYPTILDLIGNKSPLPDDIDGRSLCHLFKKPDTGKVNRGTQDLIFHYPWYARVPMSAIRSGDYKLIKNQNTDEVRLFNLSKDIGENNDLSNEMPEKTKQLHIKLMDYLRDVNAENIKPMRKARRQELQMEISKAEKKLQKFQKSLQSATSKSEKQRIKKQLNKQREWLKGRKDRLERFDKLLQMSGLW